MHVFPGVWRLWASLPATARAFLLLTAVQAFLAGIFAATQIGTSLQDTLLILATSLSLWWLSLDSLLRACAHQLPACAVLGTLGVAEMVAFAVAHGADSPGPTAVAALCAALQLAALALCRTAYRQVGWRWAGRMPGDGRLRGTELRKRAALCRSRLGAAARFDAVVLAILSVVMVTEGAPLAGSGAGVALLVGGALGGALLAAWNAAATLGALRRHARLALAADFAFPLSYGPPVIGLGVVVAGGPGTAAGARLAVACVVFLAARATLWWAVRLTWRATRALRAEGEKESRRRPGLTTSVFMQLSEDGSTLRWGWSSSVLLYHVESVRADDPARSLTLTFALGAPLTLRLGGAAAYVAWRTGLAELLPRLAAHADLLTGNDAEAGGTESAGVQKHRPSIKPESSELEGCINIHVLTSPVGSPRWDGDGDAAGHARRRSLAAALEAASGEARGWALPAWMRGVGYLASGTVPGGGAKRRSSPTKQPLVGGTSLSSQSSVGPRDDPELGAGAWEGGRGRGLEAVLGHPGLHRRGGASSAAGSTPTSEDLRFGRLLGEGSQGAVYAGRLAETPVAVKRVAAAGGELDAHIHATTPGHDNVVALRGWCVHAGSVYLVMELNVLLGPGGVPKLADFGMSVLVGAPEAGQRHVIGTAAYAAPELLEQGPPAAGAAALKADVYSFGVAVWEALARRRPHQGLDGYQIQTRWMLDPEAMRLPGPGRGRAELDPAAALLWDLVADCTAMDPAARPDMLAVLERLRAGTGQSPPQPHTPLDMRPRKRAEAVR
ncbi:Cysteine-rich receptor-like protein kinase 27 [Auxenochlorella protothecoides]|uniref:Cysteine-rich receptor-like protein kinase 27 n=1 Tax=Auxenochlorella protothecoides TaxID=3075 RepID=A0A087SA87_AUXPR|nr:Cysteine-rich receptor-like protein kinase 27 [Auxenochlorella protothecoides]KFM22641.1 Cysteine-rich receptor-like protein kinase 27 [Auxenochlorella protothecoides]